MSAEELPPTPEFLAEAAYYIRVTQIFFSAMYAVVIWDWLISLPREYEYIWKLPGIPIPKVLYLACRYWVIFLMPFVLWVFATDNHTALACSTLYNVPVMLCMWNQLFAESVLLVRTHALLGQKKVILVFLSAALMGVVAYQMYAGISQMTPLPFVVPPFEKGPCFPMVKTKGSAHILGYFVAPMIFDTMVTLMTIWKALEMGSISGAPPLLQRFLKEGIYYFILISAANLVNGIFYFQPNPSMSAICIPLSIMFPDILACRLILDLKEQGRRRSPLSTGTSSVGATTPQFMNKQFPATSFISKTIRLARGTPPIELGPIGVTTEIKDDEGPGLESLERRDGEFV